MLRSFMPTCNFLRVTAYML